MTMNKTNYKQYDTRWAKLPYPKKPWLIKNCGCGEVSICNSIIETTEYANQTPETIQPYCKQYAAPNGGGTYHSGIPAMMKHYGMTEVKEHATMKPLWDELAKGDRVAIYLMGKKAAGTKGIRWTSSGHFVCSTDYKYEDGKHKVYVKDSNSSSALRNGWISYEENMKNAVLKVWSGKIKTLSATDYRPTTPYEGTLPKATVKEGSSGDDVKACQTFLNWCINVGLSVDGKAGPHTVNAIKVYQKTYELGVDGVFGSKSKAKAEEIVKEHEKKGYDGEYPNTNVSVTVNKPNSNKLVAQAKALAWSKGTDSSKYKWKGGSATAAFKAALEKAYPNRKSWGKAPKVGCSCDVFVGTCVNTCGIGVSNFPRGLDQQKKYTNSHFERREYKNKKPYDVSKDGDVVMYERTDGHHVLIRGNGVIYEAGFENSYGHVQTNLKKLKTSRPRVIILRPLGTYKATETRSYLKEGDEGEEVKKLQKYINWFFFDKYGKDVISVDGKFGANTQNYTKLMQSDLGFEDCDGLVGPKTVEAMKAYKK